MNAAVLAAAAAPAAAAPVPGWGWVWAGYLLTAGCAGAYVRFTGRSRGSAR